MRIGVNAVPLRVSGGGARYVFSELMQRLLAHDTENEYVIFCHPLGLRIVNQLPQVHPHRHARPTAAPIPRVIEVACEEELFEYRDEFDLFFGPLNNLQPRIYDRPSVAILHDIQEQFFPEYFKEADLRARREIYPEICRAATVLVTISEFCKQSIVDKFAIDPAKIEVVYNAPQAGLVNRPAGDDGQWHRRPLPDGFLFYPANGYLHKNHALLLDALVQLRDAGDGVPPVVFTGFELPHGYPLRREIEQRGLQQHCHVFNEVSVDEFRWLFRHALALVMPTRFEGFGMPAVEALACGCPVVCADLPPLREIAGGNALYFDPHSAAALVAQLRRLRDDPDLRRRLVDAGPPTAERFSWERSAERIRAIFELACERFYGFDRVAGDARPDDGPRIGLRIAAAADPQDVTEAVKDVWRTGYVNATLAVDLPPAARDDADLRNFLRAGEVPSHHSDDAGPASPAHLLDFARDEDVELVGEILAGHGRLLPTALHSLAWARRHDPDKVIYLGELWEEEDDRVLRTARLRVLDTGDWKLENYLYPQMLFIAPRTLRDWDAGRRIVADNPPEWRWALVRQAHREGRLCVVRRTLATCDPSTLTVMQRYCAVRAGVGVVHDDNGQARGGGLLSSLKPVLRPAARLLPTRWREKGKQVWRHLASEL